jgi:seryl-tRNA synthetase
MLDIKFIRENLDLVKEGARKKRVKVDLDRLVVVDDDRRKLLAVVEEKRSKQNAASETIAKAPPGEKAVLLNSMKELKDGLLKDEERLKAVMHEWQLLMVLVPNIPDMTVPEGESDADNKEIRTWGTPPTFSFTPKSHVEIMENLGMVDFARGTKVSGFRGYFLKGAGAELNFAIWNFVNEEFCK